VAWADVGAGSTRDALLDARRVAGTFRAMKRILLVAAAVVVLAAVILAVRLMAGPRIHPTLSVAVAPDANGRLRAPIESTVQLQVGIHAPAYVYLFDEVNGIATLVGPHDGPAWQAGVYESESEALLVAGIHKLAVIASPTPRTDWKGVTTSELLVTCKDCESASVTLEVFGEIPKREFPKINPNQEFNLPPEGTR
jgi:hypothetical protein